MNENFKDGKNPQGKGDSARHGIPKKASIAQLKKIRSSDSFSKRKKQLAHWQINMRQGKSKNEEMTVAADAGIPADTANMGPRYKTYRVLDKRRKKKQPKVLKRFREF